MLAIAELLVALIVALFEAIIGLVLLAIELLFVALTQGLGAARERAAKVPPRERSPESRAEGQPPVRFRWHWSCMLSVVGFIAVPGIGALIGRQFTAGRIEAAKSLTQTQADSVAGTLAGGGIAPAQGPLPIHDPWGRPLELFLDDFKVATLIVVRSAGPDGRSGTTDDLLGIHTEPKPLRQMAGEVRDAALAGIREKARKLLGRANEDQP